MLDKSAKILVVDDIALMRKGVCVLLNEFGFAKENIREADNGKSALDMLRMEKADLVISDVNMPVMRGIELVRAIRLDDELKTIPVLLMSTDDNPMLIQIVLAANATGFVDKNHIGETLEKVIDDSRIPLFHGDKKSSFIFFVLMINFISFSAAHFYQTEHL